MILSSSIIQYNTHDIRRLLDTKISELSNDGVYDYIPYPTYDVQSPYTAGPFWKGDTMLIKWNYMEELNNLIPSTSIYLVSGSSQRLLYENIPTEHKNINWLITNDVETDMWYYIRVESNMDNKIISDRSEQFKFDERYIEIISPAITHSIQANQGEQYTLKWNGHGTSDYFKIELIEFNSSNILFKNRIGRIIKNQDPKFGGEIVESNELLALETQNVKVIKVLDDKYYSPDGIYNWVVNDIEDYNIDKVQLKITDLKYGTMALSDTISLKVGHISVGQIGRGIQLNLNSPLIITGSGPGNVEISAYGFNPSNFVVSMSGSFNFQYTSTNAVRVYLKKESDQYYYEEIGLSGQHTITNVTKDEKYILNAEDSNQRLKTILLDVKLLSSNQILQTDITKLTLQELLIYATSLMQEVQTSGDSIIEPSALVNAKISYYTNEALQTTPESDERAVWYLLKSLNQDVLLVFIEGVIESPKVLLFDGTILKNKVIALNQEIGRRYNNIIITPCIVSGYVYKDNGTEPLQGVVMTFSSIGTFSTNRNGYYEASVPYNYTGSLIPSLSGYRFEPQFIVYHNNPIQGNIEVPPFRALVSVPLPKNFSISCSGIPNNKKGIELGSVMDLKNSLDFVITDNGTYTQDIDITKHNQLYIYLTQEAWNGLKTIKIMMDGEQVPKNLITETMDSTVYTNGKKYTFPFTLHTFNNIQTLIEFDFGFS